jgi:peptidoglycan-N-acetylglucosamine deacetylase
VLAALDRAQAKAVFFVVGEQVARYPGVVREIANAGHEVAFHGFRHQTRRQWLRRILEDDTRRGLECVADATGVVPRLYRPPHGAFSISGLRFVRSLGLQPLLWSRWGRDWRGGATASSIAVRATMDVKAGDVVLLHDADHYCANESWRRTVAALPLIFERLEGRGLSAEAPTSLQTEVRSGSHDANIRS